ncbi:MAG: lysozyme inhibitor LprI family protein [Acidobacteriota bacterium]
MKRDYVEEILSKKERTKYNERDNILYDRIRALDSVVEHCYKIIDTTSDPLRIGIASTNLKENGELHKYIPIGIIACVESYFRSTVKELIDIGSPFSDKASNLREIKFDFTVVQAIEGRKVSVGDFLSHLIPMKSFDDISSTLGVLTGKDFLNELKPYFFEKSDEEKRFPSLDELSKDMHTTVGKIYGGVKEAFRLRNIFCHEASEPDIINVSEIYHSYLCTKKFLEAANEFLWDLIDPTRPQSNYEWSLRLSAKFEVLNSELEYLVNKISSPQNRLNQEFLEVQKAWESYKEKRIELVVKEWDGGSGTGLAMLGEEIYLTEQRINELKKELENERYYFEDVE